MGNKIKSTGLAWEKDPSSATNTPATLLSAYESFPNMNYSFYRPKIEKNNNGNRSGKNAATKVYNNYWSQMEFQISDEVEMKSSPKLLHMAAGAVPVRSLAALGVYSFAGSILPPSVGNILPARGLVTQNASAFFRFAGMTLDKLKIAQKAGERAKIDATLVGTGKAEKDPASFSPFPAAADPNCIDSYKTVLKYKKLDDSVVNLNTLGTWIDFTFEHDNLLRRNKRRGGDPTQTLGGATGAYVRKIPRGDAENAYNTSMSMTVDFEDMDNWIATVSNTKFKEFSILFIGDFIATVSSVDYYEELEIIIPSFSFEEIGETDEDGDATDNLRIIPLEDPTTKGTWKYRYQTALTSFAGVSS